MLPNKLLLAPGPWKAVGNTVKDGTGRTVAVVFSRNATAHAHWIAEIPAVAEMYGGPSELSQLRRDLSAAHDRIANLREEVADLRRKAAESK